MTLVLRPAGRRGRHHLWAVAAAILAALSGCAVGPNFKRPDTPAPPGYVSEKEGREEPQGEAVATGGSSEQPLPADKRSPGAADFGQHVLLGSAPAADWWTVFRSPELEELIRQAVQDNHTLAAAQATLAQAKQLVIAQAGGRYPQLDATAGAGRQKYGSQFLGTFSVPPFSYASLGLSGRYTLDYTGGVARSIEQREALAQYQRSEVDAAYLSLTGSVVSQAVTIAATRAQIKAMSDLLADDRDNVKLVRTAFENGSVSKVDVLTAESQLAADETLLPPLYQQLAIARHALAVVVGRAPDDWVPPDFDLSSLQLPRELPVSLPSELVHHRPDILAAEAQLHAATAAVGVATANLYPQITLTGTAGQQVLTQNVGRLFDRSSTAWSIISGLTAPVFDGGTLRAERRAAVDSLHASAEQYQQVVLQAFSQVADLLDALEHDAGLLAAQSQALTTAQSSLELARESYQAGNSGLLQVLDAQRQRQQAQLGFLRAQAQQYLDTVQLFLALGGSRVTP